MDYGKIETQSLDLLKFSYEELESFHRFNDNEKWNEIITNSALKEMKKTKSWKKKVSEFFDVIVSDLEYLRNGIFKNYIDMIVYYPINLFRLINRVKSLFNIPGSNLSDLNPLYIVSQIKSLT